MYTRVDNPGSSPLKDKNNNFILTTKNQGNKTSINDRRLKCEIIEDRGKMNVCKYLKKSQIKSQSDDIHFL